MLSGGVRCGEQLDSICRNGPLQDRRQTQHSSNERDVATRGTGHRAARVVVRRRCATRTMTAITTDRWLRMEDITDAQRAIEARMKWRRKACRNATEMHMENLCEAAPLRSCPQEEPRCSSSNNAVPTASPPMCHAATRNTPDDRNQHRCSMLARSANPNASGCQRSPNSTYDADVLNRPAAPTCYAHPPARASQGGRCTPVSPIIGMCPAGREVLAWRARARGSR